MTVLIFANGELRDGVNWIRPYLDNATAVIAADGGSRHLHELQYPPDVVIGDLDSLTAEIKTWLESEDTAFLKYPSAKDETDLELALLYAADHYPDNLLLFGTLGGRLDQTLANMLLLTHPRLDDRRLELVTANERAWLIRTEDQVQGNVGDLVSLIPLGGDVHIRATVGLQWPLQDETLAFGLARGVSNVIVDTPVSISVQSGSLLCIHTTNTVF